MHVLNLKAKTNNLPGNTPICVQQKRIWLEALISFEEQMEQMCKPIRKMRVKSPFKK